MSIDSCLQDYFNLDILKVLFYIVDLAYKVHFVYCKCMI